MADKMAPLTAEETKWIKKVQKVLNECPSTRIGAYTTGDKDVRLYDKTFDEDIQSIIDNSGGEFGGAVEHLDCDMGRLLFPFHVHSTSS